MFGPVADGLPTISSRGLGAVTVRRNAFKGCRALQDLRAFSLQFDAWRKASPTGPRNAASAMANAAAHWHDALKEVHVE